MSLGSGQLLGTGGAARFSRTRGRMGSHDSAIQYPSPFFDIAHTYLPSSVKQMFRWCRYYFMVNPLINAVVFKMSEYPVTDIVLDTEIEDLKDKWKNFLHNQLRYRAFQIEVGLDYHCFHGDVKAITEEGVFRLRDLVGKELKVLSKDGTYRPATFVESLSEQELLEVEFRDGRTVLATPEHLWPVSTCGGGVVKVPTTKLKGRSIFRNVAPRPEKNDDFYEGVPHGFVFGDGTLYNGGDQSRALFCGAKEQMLNYFEGYGAPPYKESRGHTLIHGLPAEYKQLPKNSASASYWYGFISGFLAADGSVDVAGCTVLTQRSKAIMDAIAEQLPRIGMIAGIVRGYFEETEYGEGTTYVLSLFKQYMLPEDFLLVHHRAKFEDNFEPTKYGTHVTVKDVHETGIFEKVYCCMEQETNTFTIDNGVLTGNTYGNAMVSIFYPFIKNLKCPNCGFTKPVRDSDYNFRNYQFEWICPKCDTHGPAKVLDHYIKAPSGIRLIRWSPEDIDVRYNDLTGDYQYYYEIPQNLKNDITMGKKSAVETVPQLFIDALRLRKAVVFSKDNIYHFKRPTLAGKDRGWGTPMILPVLKDTFYLQVLRKAQESIALEHIVPLRILFPQAGSSTSDPYTSVNLQNWQDQVASEVRRWRTDPNYIPILPLPVGHQTIGGDGRALLLNQEIRVWSEHIIAGMGIPVELIFGGLSFSGSNVSLRMLENRFLGYNQDQLSMLRWVIKKTSDYLGWPQVASRFKPFKMADDLQRKAYLFQLSQAGKLSDESLMADADHDSVKEDKLINREAARRHEAQKKSRLLQAEMEGESMLVQTKWQSKAQAQQQQEQMVLQNEMSKDQAAFQGQLQGQMAKDQMAMQQGQPAQPLPPELQPSPRQPQLLKPPKEIQSKLSLQSVQKLPPNATGERLAGQANVDIILMGRQIADHIAGLPPTTRPSALAEVRNRSPQLYDVVLGLMGSAPSSTATAQAARPLPEQKPPRRGAEAAVI